MRSLLPTWDAEPVRFRPAVELKSGYAKQTSKEPATILHSTRQEIIGGRLMKAWMACDVS